MPKKWNDIKHQGMTPRQIKTAKKRVKEFARDLVAHFESFKPHLDVVVVSDGIIIGSAAKSKKSKKEARGGHHSS